MYLTGLEKALLWLYNQSEMEVVRWLQAQTETCVMPPELVQELLQLPPVSPSLLEELPPSPPDD